MQYFSRSFLSRKKSTQKKGKGSTSTLTEGSEILSYKQKVLFFFPSHAPVPACVTSRRVLDDKKRQHEACLHYQLNRNKNTILIYFEKDEPTKAVPMKNSKKENLKKTNLPSRRSPLVDVDIAISARCVI